MIDNINEKLLEFLKINLNEKELNGFIKNRNLFCLFKYNKYEVQNDLEILEEFHRQEIRNGYFLKEIKNLNRYCNEHGVEILFLKGFILAKDLYLDPSMRNSMDIDILIKFGDLEFIDNYLKKLGYKPMGDASYTNSVQCVKEYKTVRDELTHVTSYNKIDYVNGKELLSEIEVHLRPYHYLPFSNYDSDFSIFKRKRRIYIDEIHEYIETLGIVDTVIQLCAHFLRHFYWEYIRYVRINRKFNFRLDLIHEIALFLDKYIERIEINDLIHQAKELNQIDALFLVLEILQDIYEDYINKELISKVELEYHSKELENNFGSRFVSCVIKSSIYSKLYFESSNKLANSINQVFQATKNIDYIYSDKSDSKTVVPLKAGYFNINKVEIQDASMLDRIKSKIAKNCENSVYYSWSSKYLNVKIELNKQYRNISMIRISFAKDDNISSDCEFSIVRGKEFNLFTYNIVIDNLENHNRLRLHLINKDIVLGRENYEIKSIGNRLILNLNLNWELFNCVPYNERIVNIQTCIDYVMKIEDLYYYREFTSLPNINYCVFEPWLPEFNKYKLLE